MMDTEHTDVLLLLIVTSSYFVIGELNNEAEA